MNNKFFFPSKRSNIDSFKVMQLLSDASNLENNGKKIYHLELGEPPQFTPLLLKNEVKKLVNLNLPGYTPSNGIKELRKKYLIFINLNTNLILITIIFSLQQVLQEHFCYLLFLVLMKDRKLEFLIQFILLTEIF